MKKLLLLTLLLAACREEKSAKPEDVCGAAPLQNLVGEAASAADALDLKEGSRVLQYNAPATTDFRADRLNITIGKDGNIARVFCG